MLVKEDGAWNWSDRQSNEVHWTKKISPNNNFSHRTTAILPRSTETRRLCSIPMLLQYWIWRWNSHSIKFSIKSVIGHYHKYWGAIDWVNWMFLSPSLPPILSLHCFVIYIHYKIASLIPFTYGSSFWYLLDQMAKKVENHDDGFFLFLHTL